MSAPDNSQLAFQKYKFEVDKINREVDTKKHEILEAQREIEALKLQNEEAAKLIKVRETQIKVKETLIKTKLTHDLQRLELKQKDEHHKLESFAQQNSEAMRDHGKGTSGHSLYK